VGKWWASQSKSFKAIVVIVGGLIVLGIVGGGGNRSTANRDTGLVSTTARPSALAATPAPISVATAAAKTWVVVKTWQGDGIKDTEDFVVGNEWRIDWDFSPGQYAGIIQIYVYRSDTRQLVNLVANTQKAGSDSSFQRGAGTYYLKVNSTGGWKVAVQDFR